METNILNKIIKPTHETGRRKKIQINLAMGLVVLDEIPSHLARHTVDVRHLVAETDAVEFVRVLEQLRPEGGGDELRLRAELVDHIGDRLSMLCVESLQNETRHS